MSTVAWTCYDDFRDPATSSARWQDRVIHDRDGTEHLLCDPAADVRVAGRARWVSIDRFTRSVSAGVQNLDNPKHLVVSTETFAIPPRGRASFAVDLAAEQLHADGLDYRNGFATFNVIDVEHKLVLDVIGTGPRIHALFELQAEPVGVVPQEESFLYVIDSPELPVDPAPGSWHSMVVTLDRGGSSIVAEVDGHRLFATRDLPVDPALIKLGMGILTLWPLDETGASTSLRGQGMTAGWRDVRVSVSEGGDG